MGTHGWYFQGALPATVWPPARDGGSAIVKHKSEHMHYHLIGICGTAMASLAGMLQARGHHVTGSDQNVYPPMSTMLRDLSINVLQGFNREHLTPAPDCVIVGNAIPRGNPEVDETLKRKV